METNKLNVSHHQCHPPKMSILGIIFLIMGAPNIYAFFQSRVDNVTYGGGVPRYAFAVLLAIAIASVFELSVIAAA
ncbi:MAG: hypothetical protein ACFBSG_19030 [Leptolyngbyaceae cyanobacterium]